MSCGDFAWNCISAYYRFGYNIGNAIMGLF